MKPVHRPRLTCRHCGLPKRSFLSSASARGPARAGQAVTTVSSVRLGPRGAKAPEARAQVSGHTCCGTGRRRPSGRRCGGLHGRAAAFRGLPVQRLPAADWRGRLLLLRALRGPGIGFPLPLRTAGAFGFFGVVLGRCGTAARWAGPRRGSSAVRSVAGAFVVGPSWRGPRRSGRTAGGAAGRGSTAASSSRGAAGVGAGQVGSGAGSRSAAGASSRAVGGRGGAEVWGTATQPLVTSTASARSTAGRGFMSTTLPEPAVAW